MPVASPLAKSNGTRRLPTSTSRAKCSAASASVLQAATSPSKRGTGSPPTSSAGTSAISALAASRSGCRLDATTMRPPTLASNLAGSSSLSPDRWRDDGLSAGVTVWPAGAALGGNGGLLGRHSLMLRLKWMKSPLRSASGSKRLWDFFAVAGHFPWYQYSAFRRGGPSNRCFTFRPYCQRVRFVMNDSVSPNRPMVTEDISIKSVSRRNGW
jgi:hypothetical protein